MSDTPLGETRPPETGEQAASQEPRPAARKKRKPITSLREFFDRRAARPPGFLKDMAAVEQWSFDEDDVEATLETHAERDATFARTVQLIAAAMKERDGRFVATTVAFGDRAIRRRLRDNPHAIGFDPEAGDTADERLDRFVRVLGPRLRETKRRAESTNLLLARTLCLNHTHGLDTNIATEKLVAALGIEPGASPGRQRAKLVWLGERPKELRTVLELLAPSVRAMPELSERVGRLEAALSAEREARQTADEEVVRLSRTLADLEKTVAAARAEIETSREKERTAGVHADHNVRRANARIAGMLDGPLRDLVVTIDEALSVDPPRTHIAREKAETVLRELDRQVAWLRS